MLTVTLFMLLGVTGKSAQLPLYVWLPDAMAGPTPVSALIHAATMVTAGVYLIARSHVLYSSVPAAQNVVMWIGALTALFAATIAVAQNDIKKVLAYSTISQLGFMVTAVGMGAFTAGMFHLTTHAFFKALLFLGAGSVILGMEGARNIDSHSHVEQAHGAHFDPQDMTLMGGLRKKMPVTFWVYLAGALALAGIAPLAGFFSKDEILAAASHSHAAILIVLLVAAFLTAFYMGRQLIMVFFGKPRTENAENARENIPLITLPLVLLAFLSIFGGLLNLPGSLFMGQWLEHTLGGAKEEGFNIVIAFISLLIALTGLTLAWLLYRREPVRSDGSDPLEKMLGPVYRGAKAKWRIDEAYQFLFVKQLTELADEWAGTVDQGIIDGAAVGLGSLTKAVSHGLRKLQNGLVRTYALTVFAGVVLIFTWLVTR
jgi:NADH-quinone oxidoreductase subunit L